MDPYSITNKGLEFRVPTSLANESTFPLPLKCGHYMRGFLEGVHAISLKKYDREFCYRTCSNPEENKYLLLTYKVQMYLLPEDSAWSRRNLEDVTRSGSSLICIVLQRYSYCLGFGYLGSLGVVFASAFAGKKLLSAAW